MPLRAAVCGHYSIIPFTAQAQPVLAVHPKSVERIVLEGSTHPYNHFFDLQTDETWLALSPARASKNPNLRCIWGYVWPAEAQTWLLAFPSLQGKT